MLDTATWRANPDWGNQLGYSAERLAEMNRRAVGLLESVRADHADLAIVINGAVGPRGDGYVVSDLMSAAEAETYHATQITTSSAAAAARTTVMSRRSA